MMEREITSANVSVKILPQLGKISLAYPNLQGTFLAYEVALTVLFNYLAVQLIKLILKFELCILLIAFLDHVFTAQSIYQGHVKPVS